MEYAKQYHEMAIKSREIHEIYEEMKAEKAKVLSMITICKQRNLEAQEKMRILNNEIEILKTARDAKQQELLAKEKEHLKMVSERDALRSESNRLMTSYRSKRDEVEGTVQKMDLLQKKIEMHEKSLVQTKSSFEVAMEQRNKLANYLIERNDELCLLYERINVQTNIIRQADLEIRHRDDDKVRLEVEIRSLERDIINLKNLLPQVRHNKAEVNELFKDFQNLRQIEFALGLEVEAPEWSGEADNERHRVLAGTDLDHNELAKKANRINERLSTREQEIEEKTLFVKKLVSSCQEIQNQLDAAKKTSTATALQLADYQKRFSEIDRQLMSNISELSMVKARAIQMDEERTELKQAYVTGLKRFEQGLPPSDEFEEDWKVQKRIMEMKEKEETQRKKAWKDICDKLGIDAEFTDIQFEQDSTGKIFFPLPDGSKTTAIPRPNAYKPEGVKRTHFDDELDLVTGIYGTGLPIPQAYGNLAPFKSESTSHHVKQFYRAPVEKEVQI